MNFSDALIALKEGHSLRTRNWPSGTYIAMQMPDETSKITIPSLYMHLGNANMPWTPIHIDLFTDEWAVIGEPIVFDE